MLADGTQHSFDFETCDTFLIFKATIVSFDMCFKEWIRRFRYKEKLFKVNAHIQGPLPERLLWQGRPTREARAAHTGGRPDFIGNSGVGWRAEVFKNDKKGFRLRQVSIWGPFLCGMVAREAWTARS